MNNPIILVGDQQRFFENADIFYNELDDITLSKVNNIISKKMWGITRYRYVLLSGL
jgi:hypothetical protein